MSLLWLLPVAAVVAAAGVLAALAGRLEVAARHLAEERAALAPVAEAAQAVLLAARTGPPARRR